MLEFEQKERYDFNDFRHLVEILRGPGGCPWDAAQDHLSIRRGLLEEAYELAHAIDSGDLDNLREELGDVLLQVLFHARIEEEQGRMDFDDVCDAAVKKLIFRHPHVFGSEPADTAEDALSSWDAAKRLEKSQDTVSSAMSAVAETLPALWRAEKIQKKAAKAGFTWPDISGAMEKVREETEELRQAIAANDPDNITEEIGDLLFATVNTARFLNVDPEKALHQASEKYIRRFRYMEEKAQEAGKRLETMPLLEQEHLYQSARVELEGKEMQFFDKN